MPDAGLPASVGCAGRGRQNPDFSAANCFGLFAERSRAAEKRLPCLFAGKGENARRVALNGPAEPFAPLHAPACEWNLIVHAEMRFDEIGQSDLMIQQQTKLSRLKQRRPYTERRSLIATYTPLSPYQLRTVLPKWV